MRKESNGYTVYVGNGYGGAGTSGTWTDCDPVPISE